MRLERWDPKATDHGGLATVAVTRTALVTRATGPEAPQVATYEFRVHRHGLVGVFTADYFFTSTGPPTAHSWLAVDFLRPDVNRWITDLAGATLIVPESGHG